MMLYFPKDKILRAALHKSEMKMALFTG